MPAKRRVHFFDHEDCEDTAGVRRSFWVDVYAVFRAWGSLRVLNEAINRDYVADYRKKSIFYNRKKYFSQNMCKFFTILSIKCKNLVKKYICINKICIQSIYIIFRIMQTNHFIHSFTEAKKSHEIFSFARNRIFLLVFCLTCNQKALGCPSE